MWKTEKVPINEKTLVWIKDKVDSTKEGQIIIKKIPCPFGLVMTFR